MKDFAGIEEFLKMHKLGTEVARSVRAQEGDSEVLEAIDGILEAINDLKKKVLKSNEQ